MFDITPIIEAVVALVAVLITTVVIPYVKARTSSQQQQEINEWVKIAVAAAEQMYVGQNRGVEKKRFVLNWLEEHGVKVDMEHINAMIEAAVYELNKGVIPYE